MARIKTKKCESFNGVDLVRAREPVTQRDFAAKCYLSVHKYRKFEDGRFIVIPIGFEPIDQADFDIIQDALR